jgi:hypothetical protein
VANELQTLLRLIRELDQIGFLPEQANDLARAIGRVSGQAVIVRAYLNQGDSHVQQ